ncbi:MAG: di-trans,poly-cis-decaprenylcistransferase [Chlamydiae bacterium RIFCSPHIGHO2_12_FULL_27_8]|nr:MAG: di-trans,poly-cis-decaprenylcistransferase [Chlamydiae bacterium RIFCSPHIGHO2_12_FULL_27_8]OGN66896.1 MAG: di-trans,poly-cis-decaprenylcistransferase [Chlamydiae bacterium RIFCSPLOWO2_01_FULL_28_7]
MIIESQLEQNIPLHLKNIPKHVAIIMDGNRRWAKKKKLPSAAGHSKGASVLTNIVKASLDLSIQAITVFAFSTENWSRSKNEINNLMNLFELYLKKQKKFLKKNRVALNIIGDLSKLPENILKAFLSVKDYTKENPLLKLTICINYGSRDEIKRAFIKIYNEIQNKKIDISDISEDLISKYLDTADLPDPDLLIRTSGEKRISNFLLWQISYSEIYISDKFWPDFTIQDFKDAILEYQKRKRRLGGSV